MKRVLPLIAGAIMLSGLVVMAKLAGSGGNQAALKFNTTVNDANLQTFIRKSGLCIQTTQPDNCLNNLVETETPMLGVATVYAGMQQIIETNKATFADRCHRAIHYLGQYAGRTITNIRTAFQTGGPYCQYGYYHGVIEGHDFHSEATLRRELPDVCAQLSSDPTLTTYGECTHALGHSVVIQIGYNIAAGLSVCRTLRSDTERSACGTGIFMSWSNKLDKQLMAKTSLPAEMQIVPPERRWEMCPSMDDLMAGACILFFTETADLTITGMQDFHTWCADAFANREEVLVKCHTGVGRVVGGEAGFREMGGWAGVIAVCEMTGDKDAVTRCLEVAYATASGFNVDNGMDDKVCDAWKGRPQQEEQCALAQSVYARVMRSAREQN